MNVKSGKLDAQVVQLARDVHKLDRAVFTIRAVQSQLLALSKLLDVDVLDCN